MEVLSFTEFNMKFAVSSLGSFAVVLSIVVQTPGKSWPQTPQLLSFMVLPLRLALGLHGSWGGSHCALLSRVCVSLICNYKQDFTSFGYNIHKD